MIWRLPLQVWSLLELNVAVIETRVEEITHPLRHLEGGGERRGGGREEGGGRERGGREREGEVKQ